MIRSQSSLFLWNQSWKDWKAVRGNRVTCWLLACWGPGETFSCFADLALAFACFHWFWQGLKRQFSSVVSTNVSPFELRNVSLKFCCYLRWQFIKTNKRDESCICICIYIYTYVHLSIYVCGYIHIHTYI